MAHASGSHGQGEDGRTKILIKISDWSGQDRRLHKTASLNVHLMEGKDECSDLWRELGKEERSEAESPLAPEEQGCQKPNPAEEGVIGF